MPGTQSRNHAASLLPEVYHDPDLLSFLRKRVSLEMIDYVSKEAATVIDVQESAALPTPPLTPTKVDSYQHGPRVEHPRGSTDTPDLHQFICYVVESSRVQMATLACGLVYLRRLKDRLPKLAKGAHPRDD